MGLWLETFAVPLTLALGREAVQVRGRAGISGTWDLLLGGFGGTVVEELGAESAAV